MLVRSLYVRHFRNYEEAYVEFGPHINILYGSNAQGKTSLLEAIHCLMIGRSFRAYQNQELIKNGLDNFYLEAHFVKHGIEQKLRMGFNGSERRIFYNHTQLAQVSSLLGLIQGVVLTPDDVQLIKGPPALRRQFLDVQIAQVDPFYVHHLTRYSRALRQRNQLLKAKQTAAIETWEYEMSQSAAYIILQRTQAVRELQQHCQHFHTLLTEEKDLLQLEYKTFHKELEKAEDIRNQLIQQLQKQRGREIQLGYTLSGPHKDDLMLALGKQDMRFFASEGQQRSFVTALRFAEWMRLKGRAESIPLMMVDDVGISLDYKRRLKLFDQLTLLGQVFLTLTDETLCKEWQGPKHLFHVQQGRVYT